MKAEPRIYAAEPLEKRYYFESLMDDVELSYVHGAASGVRVTERTAMRTAAVFSCIRVIAESIAGIDLHVYRRLPNGGTQVFPGWLDTLLSLAPNPSQTRVEFLEQIIRHFEIWHRCYAEVVQGDGGRVVALMPLHPSRVKPERLPNGRLSFVYTDGKTGNTRTFSQDEMFWMHGFSDDGETGEPLLELGKETIGLCRAMELHAARWFGNGARPGVVLESEQSLSPETVERLRESWERIHRGPQNSHRTAILDSGVKAHEFDGASMQDSQFTQSLEFETSRVCALFRVPPHKIQLLNRATFANVEQQEIDFRNSCIAPRCVRLEQAFCRSLIVDPANFFVRFDLNDLERGDSASRIAYLTAAVDRGLLSVNEARAREGLNPVAGGDVHFFPLNMTTLEVMNEPVAVQPANVQPVLDRLAAGGITPNAAKVLLTAQNPMLSEEQVEEIVAGSYAAAQPDRAQVTALLQVIEDVATGVLTPDGATAVIAAAFPQLDDAQVQQIIGGVRVGQAGPPQAQPPLGLPAPAEAEGAAPEVPADPTTDPLAAATSGANMAATALNGAQIASLLNILTQATAGAISVDAAVLVITSSFPTISEDVARQMVASTPPRPEGSATEPGAAEAGGAVAGARRTAFQRLEGRDCGTGSGGFQPGNDCAKGGGAGGAEPGNKTGFSGWREQNGARLDSVRASIVESQKISDDLISNEAARRKAAYEAKDAAQDKNDDLKEQMKVARRNLRDALVAGAKTQEEKDRWAKENIWLIDRAVRPSDVESNDAARAALREARDLDGQRQQVVAQINKHNKEIEDSVAFEKSLRADAAKEAWSKLSAHAKEFSTSAEEGISTEQYEKASERFSDAVKSVPIVDKDGKKDQFTEETKNGVDEFVTTAISPTSAAAREIGSSSLTLDKTIERAYVKRNEINLNPSSTATTYAHELGHIIERDPAVREAAIEFHASRCKPEEEVSLSEKYPDSGYAAEERGNADAFGKAMEAVYGQEFFSDPEMRAHYTGKVYRSSDGEIQATEIVSMGMQMMHDNPAAFAQADPEYFDFTLGIMSGSETRYRRRGAK